MQSSGGGLESRAQLRLRLVEAHVAYENAHDLTGVLSTFGEQATFYDEPWAQHYEGLDGVRQYYGALMTALPDLAIHILHRHVAEETIVLEVMVTGTHQGTWRGLPATGRRMDIPLCAVYTFTDDDRLAAERAYYDRAGLLRQLGVYREPQSVGGQVEMVLGHPITLARAFWRVLMGKSSKAEANPGI